MQVGIFCSSNKPHLWNNLYESLSHNNVDFNLCIAGPNPPIEPLPGNVKYIQTNVKPAQCWFIAAHNVVGDYIMYLPDDVVLSHGCLDDLVKLIDGKMTISSPNFMLFGKKVDHRILSDPRGYPSIDPRSTSPDKNIRKKFIMLDFPLPAGSMMYRETFDQLGGFDKHFVALSWDLDMAFELISRGGKIVISDIGLLEEIPGGKISVCRFAHDYYYLIDMWLDDNNSNDKILNRRKKPVDPLIYNNTVLTVSQGVKIPKLPSTYSKKRIHSYLKYCSSWS